MCFQASHSFSPPKMLRTACMRATQRSAHATKFLSLQSRLASTAAAVKHDDVRVKEYGLPKAWTSETLDKSSVFFEFADDAQKEVTEFVKSSLAAGTDVNTIKMMPTDLPKLARDMRLLDERHLINGPAFAIVKPIKGLDTVAERKILAFVQAQMLGETPVQNAEGIRAIQVYNRDNQKRMKDGQRYHQSREGGSIHTDNVNIPELWDYMALTCLQSAHIGGESILCSVFAVHNFLQRHAPEALEELRQDFWWEYRGFSDKFFRAPILFYNAKGEPLIRYLRDYMESAYARQGVALTDKQRWALDCLDSVCELSTIQFRYNLKPGETLFANDTQLLHGRTGFVDRKPATLEYDYNDPVNRLYQRVWLRKYENSIADLQR